jgi:hypothetical protein
VFDSNKDSYPGLVFTSKARAYPNEFLSSVAVSANVRPGRKFFKSETH